MKTNRLLLLNSWAPWCSFSRGIRRGPAVTCARGEREVSGDNHGLRGLPYTDDRRSGGSSTRFQAIAVGHPEKLVMPAPPKMGQGPWAGAFSSTFTAWAGPWGVSFSANLTPDKDTGLGRLDRPEFSGHPSDGPDPGNGAQSLAAHARKRSPNRLR